VTDENGRHAGAVAAEKQVVSSQRSATLIAKSRSDARAEYTFALLRSAAAEIAVAAERKR
jgi:hypothetical protein